MAQFTRQKVFQRQGTKRTSCEDAWHPISLPPPEYHFTIVRICFWRVHVLPEPVGVAPLFFHSMFYL